MGIRNTCADWLNGMEPADDPFLKGDKDTKYTPPELRARQCGMGSTQVIPPGFRDPCSLSCLVFLLINSEQFSHH